jgi:serine/threonine protein kinase
MLRRVSVQLSSRRATFQWESNQTDLQEIDECACLPALAGHRSPRHQIRQYSASQKREWKWEQLGYPSHRFWPGQTTVSSSRARPGKSGNLHLHGSWSHSRAVFHKMRYLECRHSPMLHGHRFKPLQEKNKITHLWVHHEKQLQYLRYFQTHLGPMWRNVSADLKNLLMRMLTKDVGQRISAAGALAHPFLRASR